MINKDTKDYTIRLLEKDIEVNKVKEDYYAFHKDEEKAAKALEEILTAMQAIEEIKAIKTKDIIQVTSYSNKIVKGHVTRDSFKHSNTPGGLFE